MIKELLYYTCNTHKEDIELACRKQLLKANLPIISVSREKEIDFGDTRIILQGEPSILMMHKQVLAGLESSKADIIFMCENDVLYHPSHFDFTPEKKDVFYYNTNVWRVRYPEGHAVWTDDLQQVSGICAYRELLLNYYSNKVKEIESGNFDRHYEPNPRENWMSEFPNLDIRHDKNLTKSKWSPDEFRNKKYAKGWKESNNIPGWGMTKDKLLSILENLK